MSDDFPSAIDAIRKLPLLLPATSHEVDRRLEAYYRTVLERCAKQLDEAAAVMLPAARADERRRAIEIVRGYHARMTMHGPCCDAEVLGVIDELTKA